MTDNKADFLNFMQMKEKMANKEAEKIATKPSVSEDTIYFKKREKEDEISQRLSRDANKRLARVALDRDMKIKDLLTNIVEIWLAEYEAKNS